MSGFEILLLCVCIALLYGFYIVVKLYNHTNDRLNDMHKFNMYNSRRITITRRELKMPDEPEGIEPLNTNEK